MKLLQVSHVQPSSNHFSSPCICFVYDRAKYRAKPRCPPGPVFPARADQERMQGLMLDTLGYTAADYCQVVIIKGGSGSLGQPGQSVPG